VALCNITCIYEQKGKHKSKGKRFPPQCIMHILFIHANQPRK